MLAIWHTVLRGIFSISRLAWGAFCLVIVVTVVQAKPIKYQETMGVRANILTPEFGISTPEHDELVKQSVSDQKDADKGYQVKPQFGWKMIEDIDFKKRRSQPVIKICQSDTQCRYYQLKNLDITNHSIPTINLIWN